MARNKVYSDAMREIRRLERASRRVEKRGYSFNLPFRFTSGGTMRTEYTAEDVEFLSGLRTKDLYKYAEFVTPEGETLSGEEGRFYERSQAAKKGAQTREERRSENGEVLLLIFSSLTGGFFGLLFTFYFNSSLCDWL